VKTADLYAKVTDQIIRELEAGSVPWVRPWKTGNPGGIMPVNYATKRQYRGINLPILWSAGFPSVYWMTFKQAQERGKIIRKGETGTHVVFHKPVTIKDPKANEAEEGDDDKDRMRKRFGS
jgi:antirestriction protein ArdC